MCLSLSSLVLCFFVCLLSPPVAFWIRDCITTHCPWQNSLLQSLLLYYYFTSLCQTCIVLCCLSSCSLSLILLPLALSLHFQHRAIHCSRFLHFKREVFFLAKCWIMWERWVSVNNNCKEYGPNLLYMKVPWDNFRFS